MLLCIKDKDVQDMASLYYALLHIASAVEECDASKV